MAEWNPKRALKEIGSGLKLLLTFEEVLQGAVNDDQDALRVEVRPSSGTAVKATFDAFNKTVAATGTPERLHSTQGQKLASQIIVTPLRTNTGSVFLGTSSTNDTQQIEAPFVFGAPDGKKIDAYDIFADVAVNGEGVRVTLID